MKRTKPFRWRLQRLPRPDHSNKEGFPSYTRTPEEDVVNVLMTGTTANTFYVSANELVEEQLSVLREFEDVEFLAKATVYAREQGYKRELPIASSVVISKRDESRGKRLFRAVVHRVCKNPHDWQKFIDVCRSGLIRKGVGRALKQEIIRAIAEMSVYHAMKYPKAVRDMIRIARPREEVNRTVIKYIMEGKHEGDPQLEALYRLKHAENDREAVKAIEDGKLPFEVVTGSVPKMSPAIWEALLYQAPYFNLLRNLNNFAHNGVFDNEENVKYAAKRLADPEAVRNSKLFPFRFYIAYRMLESFRYDYIIRSALEKALEQSVENVPELEGKVCIAPDVSWSMSSSLTGDYSVVQCVDLVGVFTGILIKKCRELPLLLPFRSDVVESIAARAYEKETILDIASVFEPENGTSLSAPVEWLLKHREKVDYLIMFTDNEEWVGKPFIEALNDYLHFNPDVQVYLVTLLPYRDYPVPTIENVHFIFGWSDNVLRYIADDREKQIEEIMSQPDLTTSDITLHSL